MAPSTDNDDAASMDVDDNKTPTPGSSDGGGGEGGPKTPTSAARKRSKKTEVPYTQLVEEAIVAMKDRTGSSMPAIKKWLLENKDEVDEAKIKARLNITLKMGVKSGKFIKIKGSYKINPDTKKKKKQAEAARKKREKERKKEKAAKDKEAAKVKEAAVKEAKMKMSKEELVKLKAKEAEERKAKELRDKIKRRKFPMDDIKLQKEDKALGVRVKLPPTPKLDFALPKAPDRSGAYKSDTTRQGLMDNAMYVYHFFRGDVGWGRFPKQRAVVAPFTLEQWLECVQQVANGWARKSRMVPPLMAHLFVVSLQHVVPPMLQGALSPASFSEILVQYMNAMNDYYLSNRDQTTSSHLEKSDGIDTAFLLGATDEEKDSDQLEKPTSQPALYLGEEGTPLQKAYVKLLNNTDPWTLTADELLVLLAALVDDVISSSSDCAEEFDARIDIVADLMKTKRAADANYRKLVTARNKEIAEEKKDLKSADGAKVTRSNVKLTKISDAKLEKARREQQKAHDAWDKACRSKRIRLEPIGLDRNFSEVYHSYNDPERAFVVKRGNKVPTDASFEVAEESQIYRTTWHTIDKKSTMDKFMASLDVRGTREQMLHEALESISRMIHDDLKEANAKKAKLKEMEDLRKRLETSRAKFENNRKSGRLLSQSEQELINLENEITALEQELKDGQAKKEYDLEAETGVEMLRMFESESQQLLGKRANRRETKQHEEELAQAGVPKIKCSALWPSGRIDGTGIVGMIVKQMLDLERRVEKLAPWENGDRSAWSSRLESAIETWNEWSPPVLEDSRGETPPTPNGDSKRASLSPSKQSEVSNKVKPGDIIKMIRQPALQLEQRIFDVTGLSVATADLSMADDNISTSAADEEERILNAWKKIINRLKRLTAKDSKKIKQTLLDGIAAARQAHNLDALNGLREALMEHRPEGAGLCLKMALEVLEKHGGYFDDDDDSENEDEDNANADEELGGGEENEEVGISSSLSADAVMLNSSLDGHEDYTREHWIDSVRNAKTLSKLAALVNAFTKKANDKIEKLEAENQRLYDSMDAWSKGSSLRKKSDSTGETTEVWTSVNYTDEFCLAKVSEWPLWPGRKCQPKDENLASRLASLDRELVSLVGERGGLRVVPTDSLFPFSETLPEGTDLSLYSKEIRNQLDESMMTARRIVRGLAKKKKGKR